MKKLYNFIFIVVFSIFYAYANNDIENYCDLQCDLPWCSSSKTTDDICKIEVIEAKLENYVRINGTIYYFAREAFVTVKEAELLCKQIGMVLLSIENENKNSLMRRYINETNPGMEWFWTSGKRNINENKWIWTTTNENIIFTDWYPERPTNDTNNESCIAICGPYPWFDDPCTYRWHFVCEQKK